MDTAVAPLASQAAWSAATFSHGMGAPLLTNSADGSAVRKRIPALTSFSTAPAFPAARSRTTGLFPTQSSFPASIAMSRSAVGSW